MSPVKTKILSAAVFFYCLWLLQNYSGLLEFDRQQILSGDIWRIWTGHLVHTSSSHFFLNGVALILAYFTFFSSIKLVDLLFYSFIFSALISVTLLCVCPNIEWYNGLSGLLHALAAYFFMRLASDEGKVFFVGLVIVWGKVLVETIRAQSGYEHRIGDMTVITEAHLIGAFFGTATAIIYMAYFRGKGSSEYNRIETQ